MKLSFNTSIFRRTVAFLLVAAFLLEMLVPGILVPREPQTQAQAAELRETIRIPNSNHYNVYSGDPSGGFFHVPSHTDGWLQVNDLIGNNKTANRLTLAQGLRDQSIANSKITFPLFEKNLEFQLNMNFGRNAYTNRGMAIVLHSNSVNQPPGGWLNGICSV